MRGCEGNAAKNDGGADQLEDFGQDIYDRVCLIDHRNQITKYTLKIIRDFTLFMRGRSAQSLRCLAAADRSPAQKLVESAD